MSTTPKTRTKNYYIQLYNNQIENLCTLSVQLFRDLSHKINVFQHAVGTSTYNWKSFIGRRLQLIK